VWILSGRVDEYISEDAALGEDELSVCIDDDPLGP
jgi:hypothetical protein